MVPYFKQSKEELLASKKELLERYQMFVDQKLSLDMSRGKPSPEQQDLSNDMLKISEYITDDGVDCRNYGLMDGLPQVKQMFADIMGVPAADTIVGGNSSLNMMYDAVARAMLFGVAPGSTPWIQCEGRKFLCPVPGYDRHFGITEEFGFEMINIPMDENGPDMDLVERLVSSDPDIKGIWCVPKFSNPTGIVYSDEVVRRFARLQPAAEDFRIFWDNAYCVHDFDVDHPEKLRNIFQECIAAGNPDMVYMFASTSKISFSGGGLAAMCASENNIAFAKKHISVQTIGPDKLNQLRHLKFFGDQAGVLAHMKKHAELVVPKFQAVLNIFRRELEGLDVATWTEPKGGYFISVDAMPGCASRIYELCKQAGVKLTNVGATFPYGKDPLDSNLRIAPTYPPIEELELASELFCVCVKLAAVEHLLSARHAA